MVAILQLIGDFAVVSAYNLTSLASALVLSSTVVFWSIPVSWVVFKRTITIWQGIAVVVGLGGGAMVFVGEGVEGSLWLGNVLALVCAICYGMTTVAQEYVVRTDPVSMYILRFGLSAAPVGWILSASLEWKDIRDYTWTWQSILLYLSYGALVAFYNLLTTYVMQFSDATTMNLSVLTANFYSLAVSIFAFGQKGNWLYFLGFCCIPAAIVIFSVLEPKPAADGESDCDLEDLEKGKAVDDNDSEGHEAGQDVPADHESSVVNSQEQVSSEHENSASAGEDQATNERASA